MSKKKDVPSKHLGMTPKDIKRHQGMHPDSYDEIPKSKRHGPLESLKGTLAGLKDLKNGR